MLKSDWAIGVYIYKSYPMRCDDLSIFSRDISKNATKKIMFEL